ncbi:hypothetical protein L204_106335 [Cryptococcus depauperatus]
MSTEIEETTDQIQLTHSHVDLVRALEGIDQAILDSSPRHHDGSTGLEGDEVPESAATNGGEAGDLSGWSREQLQAEVLKLRRLAGDQSIGRKGKICAVRPDDDLLTRHSRNASIENNNPSLHNKFINVLTASDKLGLEDGNELKRKRKRKSAYDTGSKATLKRNIVTGKRLEKERRPELAKAIRNKMRAAVGMEFNNSVVSAPTNDFSNGEAKLYSPYFVPNWRKMLDSDNLGWLEKLVEEFKQEANMGLHPRVAETDLDLEIIRPAAYTAFTNLCKRYINENSADGAERRERYIKKRRRWARKDLKQKRRARSAGSPSLGISLPPSALHIDYMSSEYSSAGEDEPESSPDIVYTQKRKWKEMYDELTKELADSNKSGWAAGLSAKVLEVRKPRWRSQQLNDIYTRLDVYADALANTRSTGTYGISLSSTTIAPRAGHVAPSHKRFILPPEIARRGKAPRDLGEGWMWASGVAGVWPTEVKGVTETMTGEWEMEEENTMNDADRLGLVNVLERLQQ